MSEFLRNIAFHNLGMDHARPAIRAQLDEWRLLEKSAVYENFDRNTVTQVQKWLSTLTFDPEALKSLAEMSLSCPPSEDMLEVFRAATTDPEANSVNMFRMLDRHHRPNTPPTDLALQLTMDHLAWIGLRAIGQALVEGAQFRYGAEVIRARS